MWTVVYIAHTSKKAESLKKILAGEGLLVTLRAASVGQDGQASPLEILVPESEAEEANEILNRALACWEGEHS